MGPAMKIYLYDRYSASPLPELLLTRYQTALDILYPLVMEEAQGPDHVLSALEEVEVTLVGDATIAEVHLDFMDIPGATDVITFQHGEIIISRDTAVTQAAEFGEPFERELLRYMVHGMLHLHGYLDYEPEDRDAMFAVQERLVTALWNRLWE